MGLTIQCAMNILQVVFPSPTVKDVYIEYAHDVDWKIDAHRTKFASEPEFLGRVRTLLSTHCVLRTKYWGASDSSALPAEAEALLAPQLVAAASTRSSSVTSEITSCCLAVINHLRKRKRLAKRKHVI